jgi:hypothetical protein
VPIFSRVAPTKNLFQSPQLPVVFDATGAGVAAHNPTSDIWSQTHIIGAAANAILCGYSLWSTANPSSVTATCGGVNMTLVKALAAYTTVSTFPAGLWVFGLMNPPTGSQTISVTAVGGSTNQDGCQDSVSYKNVNSFVAANVVTASATSTSMSCGPVTSGVGQMIFGIFTPGATTTSTISAFNGTSRKNFAWSSGVNFTTLIGDIAGAASVTLTATDSASNPYGAIAVPIL